MINENLQKIIDELKDMSSDDRIEELNKIRLALHEHSPLKKEPVDCVIWVKADNVQANDYNPNSVAPPEMELLKQTEEGLSRKFNFKITNHIIQFCGLCDKCRGKK